MVKLVYLSNGIAIVSVCIYSDKCFSGSKPLYHSKYPNFSDKQRNFMKPDYSAIVAIRVPIRLSSSP